MATYRTKPFEVEAMVWTGDNQTDMLEFIAECADGDAALDELNVSFVHDWEQGRAMRFFCHNRSTQCTLAIGDAIIFDDDGLGFTPCEASEFNARYTALV